MLPTTNVLLILFIGISNSVASSKIECNLSEFGGGINLSDGRFFQNRTVIKQNITFDPENYVEIDGIKIGCVCRIRNCVRKCCPVGEYLNGTHCIPTEAKFHLPATKSNATFHLLFGNKCRKSKVRSLLYSNEIELLDNGDLKYVSDSSDTYFHPMDFCLDFILDESEVNALICAKTKDPTVTPTNVVGMIISLPFLLVTFLVYVILPERNLHAKCLISFVTSLFWAYVLLVTIQLQLFKNNEGCKTAGIFCLFFLLGSFFWMNVMSIDIYWTFSGLRGFSGTTKQKELKKFLVYSAYAWGCPFLLVILVSSIILSDSINPDAWYNPGIGQGQCWLKQGYPTLLYINGPMAILITINVILFVITAIKVKTIQKDTSVLRQEGNKRHGDENDRQRFYLYLKLLLAMGVNWSMEIISWVISWRVSKVPSAMWYLTDFCNAVYGVMIFFIFVFKRNIWISLRNKYKPMIMDKIQMCKSSSNSDSTTESSISAQQQNAVEIPNRTGVGVKPKDRSEISTHYL